MGDYCTTQQRAKGMSCIMWPKTAPLRERKATCIFCSKDCAGVETCSEVPPANAVVSCAEEEVLVEKSNRDAIVAIVVVAVFLALIVGSVAFIRATWCPSKENDAPARPKYLET